MRSLVPALVPAAVTALAVTTLSTVALPTPLSDAASPAPRRAGAVPGHRGSSAVPPPAVPAPAVPARAVSGPSLRGPAVRPPALSLGAATLGATALGATTPTDRAPALRGRWTWPLEPRPPVARPFVRPTSTWGAGHRGLDLSAPTGSTVRAVDDGLVAHVGVIAGRGTVTVVHRSGLRSTYEPVDATVADGDLVVRGQAIGTLAAGGHCVPATCLHLGALRGTTYLDPLTLLGAGRVRLLPLP